MSVSPSARSPARTEQQLAYSNPVPETPGGPPDATSAEDRAIDADLQYLGIELNDPVDSPNTALKLVIVFSLAVLFLLDVRGDAAFNFTALYVVVIFLAMRLQSVRWVLSVTIASLVLNLFAARWDLFYNVSGFTIKTALSHVAWAALGQVPAGILAYQSIVFQRRLERANKATMRRQRVMYERERAARSAEQDARRREAQATDDLRTHAAELTRTIESEREARRREREALVERDHLRWLTEKFQRTLLPTVPREIANGHLALGPFYQPAIQEMQMGGDFYDAMTLPNGMVGLVIGDVAGHGVEAAAQTALVTTTLRAFATEDPLSPARVLARVNRSLTLDRNFDVFVSVFYAVYDPDTCSLRFANAGHEPPILIRDSGKCEGLESTGLVVGVDTAASYKERAITLSEGDCLIMITDGITEARNKTTRKLLGWVGAAKIAMRYRDMIKRLPPRTKDGLADDVNLAEWVYREALRFAGSDEEDGQGLSDDVALLTVLALAKCAKPAERPPSTEHADADAAGSSGEPVTVATGALPTGPEYRR